MVLGQHFFNLTTDVTQAFRIEKYIPYPLYSVFNPSDHDLGEAQGRRGAARRGAGWAPGEPWESPQVRECEEGWMEGQRRGEEPGLAFLPPLGLPVTASRPAGRTWCDSAAMLYPSWTPHPG